MADRRGLQLKTTRDDIKGYGALSAGGGSQQQGGKPVAHIY